MLQLYCPQKNKKEKTLKKMRRRPHAAESRGVATNHVLVLLEIHLIYSPFIRSTLFGGEPLPDLVQRQWARRGLKWSTAREHS